MSGLYGFRSQVPITCPTGNCTWPTFSTLALCSSCSDITTVTTVSSCSMDVCVNDMSRFSSNNSVQCITNKTNGAFESNCTQWPPCNYTSHDQVNVNVTYSTPEGTLFQGVEYMFEIYSPASLSSTTAELAWPGESLQDDYLLTNANRLNQTETESYIETGMYNFSNGDVRHFENISNLALITARTNDPRSWEFDLNNCPSLLTGITSCQFNWCLKVHEGMEMVC